MDLKTLCEKARNSSKILCNMSSQDKNNMLSIIAKSLTDNIEEILKANDKDIATAYEKPKHFIDRLTLNKKRIEAMAEGILQLIKLKDPIGETIENFKTHCNLEISKIRVPLGVIGIIYEARPNVTADAIGLCIKSGNAVILRGSKDAINSNKAIVDIIKRSLKNSNFDSDCIGLIEDVSRQSATDMMTATGLIDVLIPRGGAGLIKTVVNNSKVPVIETGSGNCHIYVEKTADFEIAENIILNAKLDRPSVCNAAESLIVDQDIAEKFLPSILNKLSQKGVEIRGCDITQKYYKNAVSATEEDFFKEYNDLIISVKVVKDINQAIKHIDIHSTHHSEAIITKSKEAADRFLKEVDSAAVYVNASTRFTDGFEFGFGAEMGISTQKLHARGPMGLKELTSYKFAVRGNGQIR